MAQIPCFHLYLTDGDGGHVPTTSQIDNDFDTAANYGIVKQGLVNFAKSMIMETNRLKQPHEAVETSHDNMSETSWRRVRIFAFI